MRVKLSRIHGVGVFAEYPARYGENIARISGTRIGHIKDCVNGIPGCCVIGDDFIVTVPTEGFPLWVVNYSCSPNIEIIDGHVFALREIQIGDELTISTRGAFGKECRCTAVKHLTKDT